MVNLFFALAHMQDVAAILAPAALALLVVANLNRFSLPWQPPRELSIAILLIAYLMFNVWLHKSAQGLGPVEFVRGVGRVFYVLVIFVVFFSLKPTGRVEGSLVKSALVVAAVVGALSLYSLWVSPIWLGPVRLSSRNRLLGTLGGHNPTAGSFGGVLILVAVALRDPVHARRLLRIPTPLLAGLAAVVALAFLMTLSRGYSLALLAVAFFAYGRHLVGALRRWQISVRTVALAGAVVLGTLVTAQALSERLAQDLLSDPSVITRLQLFQRAFRFGVQSPLFGVGLGTFEQEDVQIETVIPGLVAVRSGGRVVERLVQQSAEGGLHVHNVFLQLFSETGSVGLGLFGLLFGSALLRRAPPRWSESDGGPGDGSLARARASEEDLRSAWRFNREALLYLTIFLAVGGLTSGYTFLSPSLAWPCYVVLARFVRIHHRLMDKGARILESPIRIPQPSGT